MTADVGGWFYRDYVTAIVEPDEVDVDSIPVRFSKPTSDVDRRQLALWLPYLGGTKESVTPFLSRLSEAGFTALSFDPWRNGDRAVEATPQIMDRVFAHFRRDMWPILGQSTLDAMHVLDWATDKFDVGLLNVVAGGISMGGDIALALAGSDSRISRVATIVSTPDWKRPGMTRVGEPENIIEQGLPSTYGAWLYRALDPRSNTDSYSRGPAISFDLGECDTHVPPTAATEFREKLRVSHPQSAGRIRIVTHSGLDHLAAARNPKHQDSAFEWLTTQ